MPQPRKFSYEFGKRLPRDQKREGVVSIQGKWMDSFGNSLGEVGADGEIKAVRPL
jgi:hypothetical protein